MRGAIRVLPALGIRPFPGGAGRGFIAGPSPNPTRAGAVFRIALPRAGKARVEVLDAAGRRVATALGTWLEPGSYAASWSGAGSDGRRVPAGIYLLRLTAPGVSDARAVVVAP